MPKKAEKSKQPEVSRRETLKQNGEGDIEMPECDAIHIADYLFEIGPSLSMGMGQTPLSHLEIQAWQANTGIELTSWESRVIKSLSIKYCCEIQLADAPNYPSPWIDAPYAKINSSINMRDSIRELSKL